MRLLGQFPAFVILMLIASALMLVPSAHAAGSRNWDVARGFLEHGVFFGIFAIILGLATMNRVVRVPARYHLLTLLNQRLLVADAAQCTVMSAGV